MRASSKISKVSAFFLLPLCGASAQQTWTNSQGTGFWNNTDANWGAPGALWTDGGSAIFDAGGGNPTVNAAVNVANLTLNAGKTIAGTGPLTFVGPGSLLTVNATSTINTPIAGTVTKTGAGQLDIATLNAGATLIVNAGTVRGNTTDGIKGILQINAGATFRNTAAHVFETTTSRIWINGGTLTHGPATYPEFYVSHGTSAADPGVQMTAGYWDGQNRFRSGVTAHLRINAASTAATIAGQMLSYQGGTQVYNVLGGTVPDGVDLRVSGNLGENFGGGTTHITKTGTGLMEITGTATLNGSGQFNLTQGTLRLTGTTAVNNFGGSGIAMDAANTALLQLNAANAGDSLAFSKRITGGSANARIEKIGAGTVVLTPAAGSSFAGAPAGALTVTQGRLYLNSANFTPAPAVSVAGGATFGGTGTAGAVAAANGATVEGGHNGAGTLTGGAMTLGAVAGDSVTLSGTVSGTPGYSPISVSNLAINSGNSRIRVNATGTGLTTGNTYDLLVSASPITAPNATSVLSALARQSRAFTPLVDGTGTRIQVIYGGDDSIYWTGAGGTAWNLADSNWKLTSNNSDTQYMESDTVFFHDRPEAAHTVDLSAGNVSPASVTFDNTAATTYTLQGANGIAAGTITKSGNGTVILNNTNPTAGEVALNGGTVQVSQTGGLGTGGIIFDGGALNYTGTSTTWTRNFTVNAAGGTVGVGDAGATLTTSGTLGGGGGLVKSGAGTLAMGTASPAFAGGITVRQGTLRLNNVNAAGTNGTITLGHAGSGNEAVTLSANVGSGNFTNPITVANLGTGTVTLSQPQAYSTLSGLITLNRPATFHQAGDRSAISGKITGNADTITFTGNRTTMEQTAGNASDFTGDVVIAGGTLQMNTIHGLPGTASVTVNPGTLFRTIAGANINALNGTGTVHNNSGGSVATTPLSLGNGNGGGDFGGSIQNGSGVDIVSIVKNGSGTQIFSGTNTYTGTTRINGGVLQVGNGGAGGTLGSGQITNNASLVYNRSDNINFDRAVEGAGSFTQAGPGVLTISVDQGYTGETRVTGGALLVDGNLPADGLVTVSSGATLGGGGTMGHVTVNAGGLFSPGGADNELGLSSLVLAPASIVDIELDDPASVFWNDKVALSGALALGGTWNISQQPDGIGFDFAAAPAGTSWLFMTYTGSLTPGVVTLDTAPALAPGLFWTVDSTSEAGKVFLTVAVPEPASAGLLLLGAFVLRVLRRRAE